MWRRADRVLSLSIKLTPDKRQGNRPLTRFMQPSWWGLDLVVHYFRSPGSTNRFVKPSTTEGLHLRTGGAILIYLWSVACLFATVDLIADISAGDAIIP